MVVWLLFNLVSGIYNLAVYDYTVLKAFSLNFAFNYLIRNWSVASFHWCRGAVCGSGCVWQTCHPNLVALYCLPLSSFCICGTGQQTFPTSPSSVASKHHPISQAAYISQDASGTAFSNPFFSTVPRGTLVFSLIIAILAAIVASQALITSTFQLLSQVMRMSYFTHIKVAYTSAQFHDHVYMSLANWLLMIGTVIVTAVYNNTTSLGNAYGVCVIFVTFITTCMVALVALVVWRLPILVVLPLWLIFACLDGIYLSSVLTKMPDGAWFTIIMLSAILCSILILWRFGKEAHWAAEHLDRLPPSALLATGGRDQNSSGVRLTRAFGGTPVSTVPGLIHCSPGRDGLLPHAPSARADGALCREICCRAHALA